MLDAMLDYYRQDNANPGALHTLARRAYERYEHARATVAAFINAAQPDEVVWVRGTTEGINLVASAWARPRIRPDDELLLTLAEHASNLLPWRLVAEQTGATIRYVDLDDAGRVRLDDLERKLSARTRLFSCSHVSNVTGYPGWAATAGTGPSSGPGTWALATTGRTIRPPGLSGQAPGKAGRWRNSPASFAEPGRAD